jgi:glycosyltransferase involved in cell wall biosynthesis
MPLVSIGVPVHNGERYLSQALDALLGQSWPDLEVIISDNSSNDGTEAICRAYEAKDARVRYFRQPVNIGAPHNWNFVARHARGKYFKWSSANDYCPPDMVEKCVAVLESDPEAVLCYGRTCLICEETGKREEYAQDFAIVGDSPRQRFETLYRNKDLNNAQSGLIRAESLRRTRLDRPYPGGDIVLMAELALQGRFVLLPHTLLYRRMGQQTFSSLLTNAQVQELFYPGTQRHIGFRYFRMHLDFLVTVLRASLRVPEKLRTLILVLRHAAWDRGNLWKELCEGLRGARHT